MEMEAEVPEPEEERRERRSRLNTWVAITIALLATFMGIARLKDSNILLMMERTEANRIDYWGWFQIRHVREDIAASAAASLRAQNPNPSPTVRQQIGAFERSARDQARKRVQVQRQAEELDKTYETLRLHHDQFDLAEAALAIAIALLAITALVERWWLFFVAMIPAALGCVMGLLGFLGSEFRVESLARFLGA